LSVLSSKDRIGAVFYTIYNADGSIAAADRNMPVDTSLVSEALSGQSPKATLHLPDGSSVRAIYKPIRFTYDGEIVGVLQAATPLDLTDASLREVIVFLAITALALLLASAVGSHLLIGRALRAVDRVTQKAHQIELSQDLSQRIPEPASQDEVGRLVRTFNQMLARLQTAFEAQRRFVADSSHELRTPLTVIRSNLHMLRRTADPQEHAELIDTTDAEVSRLNRMVNNLLYIAQVQAGHDLKPVLQEVELDSLLLDVFAKARSMASLKNQTVALSHEDIATVLGDRDQLQHLLLNLVDNASKYTPDGGALALGLWVDDSWARIEVSDNGRGIAANDLPSIFERFYRASDARVRERTGSGLGLAIVKSIADAHNAHVEVFSKIDEGTTFRLWLPLVRPERSLPGISGEPNPRESLEPTANTAE
jgi:signal transduction histidine kinase